MEAVLASGCVVLSILGIVGLFSTYISAIAVVGLGMVLLFRSVEVVLQYKELLCEAGATSQINASHVSQGITTELLAEMAGIVMGVLALLGIVPTTLLSVAVITYGAAMLLTSGESLCLDSFDLKENDLVRQLIRSMNLASAGAQVLVGLAAMVLGILGLVGIASTILVLVALLSTSASILMRSASMGRLVLDFLLR